MSDVSTAEQVMVSQLRETIALDHGKVRQVFDVLNCPGLTVVCELSDLGDEGDFETVSQTYHLATGEVFENAAEALLAWDSQQTDLELIDTLGHALLRYRHGLMRPLWEHRKERDKTIWIVAARGFRRLLQSLGYDIVRMEPK